MPSTVTRKRPPARTSTKPSRLPLVLGALAVLGVAILIAVFTANDASSAVTVEDVAGSPSVVTDPLPDFGGDTAADPALGQRAPQVDGQAIEGGGAVTIGAGNGPELLVFLASWCPACQAELPELVGWLDGGNLPDEVALTAVVTGLDNTRPNWPPTDWLEREGYTGETIVDDAEGTIAGAYGMSGTPFWVALDAEGQVVARASGRLEMHQVQQMADVLAQG
ncbi:TlpA family protein disulfide reductase [Egicoccus halophilus]|uniref:Thioredoxin domain-containing protein n=1 Tax=Egicoccus halophilus TaxID=1670830 RepID=A0A8J3A7P9_9ACTN|nr:TlpA disulfide reductase family protein [Egicoccus halophilus]GGI03093.1 hypothetical protein GCM10011354_02590 [Egicoccus halophilus]